MEYISIEATIQLVVAKTNISSNNKWCYPIKFEHANNRGVLVNVLQEVLGKKPS